MTDRPGRRDALRAAHPLRGEPGDYDTLLDLIGDARLVLLGEASHGTHEFYRERARITRRLIEERGFDFVAVEADWPDAYRVNRYVRQTGGDADADAALASFRRFPTWMWRNREVLAFVEWLRDHNRRRPDERHAVGFYGLDLYSLYASIDAVLAYLDRVDADAAERARIRYACFEQFGEDAQRYGQSAELGLTPSCEDEAVAQLVEFRRRADELARRDGRARLDEFFFAEQNARLVKNAEEYYRTMFRGRVESWNLRDRHMADTLEALLERVGARGRRARAVVWEYNSHLGDARATEMGAEGEWNVGQLVRERHGSDAVLVGFSTHHGTVTAASRWGGPAERKRVRPALPESYEAFFHTHPEPNFLLRLRDGDEAVEALREPRLQRAIGVVYYPGTERQSHYFRARLADQFDAVIHLDATRAVEPLEATAEWRAGEAPETYPWGL